MTINYENLQILSNIPPEQALEGLNAILALEYERIASEERIARLKIENEYKIAQLNSNKKQNVVVAPEEPLQEVDDEFNQLTGFGVISKVSAGKISKTNLTPIIRSVSAEIEESWDNIKRKSLKSKDASSARVRTLIGTFLMASIAEARFDHWPNAPDGNMLHQIREDTNNKLKSYDEEVIIPTFEYLKEYFSNKYKGTELETLKTSLYGEFIDELYAKLEFKVYCEEEYNILNSPLAKAFASEVDHLEKSLKEQILVYYLETKPRAGLDMMSVVIAKHTENHPHPRYIEESKEYNSWGEFYKKNFNKIEEKIYSNLKSLHNQYYSKHLEWLAEKKEFEQSG